MRERERGRERAVCVCVHACVRVNICTFDEGQSTFLSTSSLRCVLTDRAAKPGDGHPVGV